MWIGACWIALLLGSLAMRPQLFAQEFKLPPNGEELFHRDWSKVASDESRSGLGPMYNAVSCVACHKQGGAGGGGNNQHNVHLLTITAMQVPVERARVGVDINALRNKPLHPGLKTTSSVVLHQFSTNPAYDPLLKSWLDYPEIEPLGNLQGLESVGIEAANVRRLPKPKPGYAHGLAYMRTQRNTPSLFGLGYIDKIKPEQLELLAKVQNRNFTEISGRVAPNAGKFGWRGQSPSVRGFVLGACANELGLQTPGFKQAAVPVPLVDANANSSHSDMTPAEISAMVQYVAELPPPAEVQPANVDDAESWYAGQKHFTQARCDACHVRQIGSVVGIYSDLLLHDMGEKLNDPAALSSSPGLSQQYYGTGESLLVSNERKQEWRTPPLWGVRDSAPYLHDGRAENIEEAILAHGGEGERSRQRYFRLSAKAKSELVFYVKSLGAVSLPKLLADSN